MRSGIAVGLVGAVHIEVHGDGRGGVAEPFLHRLEVLGAPLLAGQRRRRVVVQVEIVVPLLQILANRQPGGIADAGLLDFFFHAVRKGAGLAAGPFGSLGI